MVSRQHMYESQSQWTTLPQTDTEMKLVPQNVGGMAQKALNRSDEIDIALI